jgi:hypothetical protein
MAIIKSIPIKKEFNGELVEVSDSVVVSEENYTTSGEYCIVIKSVDHCNLKLDSSNTNHVVVKALTNVTVSSIDGLIDEEWDDIELTTGACVEFRFIIHNWYILSSDGLKGS